MIRWRSRSCWKEETCCFTTVGFGLISGRICSDATKFTRDHNALGNARHCHITAKLLMGGEMQSSYAELCSNEERRGRRLRVQRSTVLEVMLVVVLVVAVANGNRLLKEFKVAKPGHAIERFGDLFVASLSNDTISSFLRVLSHEPHVAGTAENFATASYVRSKFEDAGIAAHYADYDVMLSYPVKRTLSLVLPDGSSNELPLQEEPAEGDPYSKNPKVLPTFFAYSPSGAVSGEVVYANYGRDEDFETLREKGINVTGTVVIARIGEIFRGDIVANAAAAGAVAAIIYSDPQDYAANGTEGYYPFSRWLPPSGVQRGSILPTTGDPLTPGWPSVGNAERLDMSEVVLPKIPAMPISAQDALPILAALEGEVAPPKWQGGLKLSAYRIGRGPAKLNFTYVGNETVVPIRNVIGIIEGSEDPDRYVLLGNHRDAWTFGAADPNSGTACLLEIARGLGKLRSQGWQPKRTIVLCSWDAEEYGLVGSTEWVEQNLNLLSKRAIAYINVDRAVGGPKFDGSATPQLDSILLEVTKKVKDPNAVYGTVYEAWSALNKNATPYIGRLGGGRSDFSPFLQHAGVPSYDLRYQRGYPVYHSLYDDYHWMETFGDPLFQRHVAVSAIWGLLAMRLADDAIIPFDYTAYADELETYVKKLQADLVASKVSNSITIAPLSLAVSDFRTAAVEIEGEAKMLREKQNVHAFSKQRSLNDRLLLVERSFTDPSGLVGQPWYKHLIYGPTTHNRYGSEAFPGIGEALATAMSSNDTKSWNDLQHEIWKVARAITDAALVLHGELH